MNEITIHEKNIPIIKKTCKIKIEHEVKTNYDQSSQFFDPLNNSPPNYFMEKLLIRIKNYDLYKNNLSLTTR